MMRRGFVLLSAACMLLTGCADSSVPEEPLAHHTNPVRTETVTAAQTDTGTETQSETVPEAEPETVPEPAEPTELDKRIAAIYHLEPVPVPAEGWTDETLLPVVSVAGRPAEFPVCMTELLYGFHPVGENAAFYEENADKIFTHALLLTGGRLVMSDVCSDDSSLADALPGMIEFDADWVVPLADGSDRYPVSVNCVTVGSTTDELNERFGEPHYYPDSVYFETKCGTDSLLITINGTEDTVLTLWIRDRK